MKHNIPCMPSRRRWLSGVSGLGLASLTPWVLADPDTARVLRPRALSFPRDHGAHPEWRTEWWYMTGHVQDRDRRELGFQLTFFRTRVDEAQSLSGRLAARQLVFAHAAITDVAEGRLRHDERMARWNGEPSPDPDHPGAVFAALDDTDVALRGWRLRRLSDGRYRARLDGEGLGLDLLATPTQALLLQGEAGFSRKGPEPSQASFYVTEPQLRVEGRLRLGSSVGPVQGRAWLDHEWSEALLHPEALGWDWVGMNLDDGGSLTAFQLRRADGSALWAGGAWRSAEQAPYPSAGRRFGPQEVRFEALAHWRSPHTGAHYPVRWRLHTPLGSHTVQALAEAQELDARASTGTVYWEGLSRLHAPNGRPVGSGYLEMTGYAQRLRL